MEAGGVWVGVCVCVFVFFSGEEEQETEGGGIHGALPPREAAAAPSMREKGCVRSKRFIIAHGKNITAKTYVCRGCVYGVVGG